MNSGHPRQLAFKVAKGFDNDTAAYVTSPEASVMYGPTTKNPMIRYRHALRLMTDEKYHTTHEKQLEGVRHLHTCMKIIVLDVPLGDVRVKDGNQWLVPVSNGRLTEWIEICKRLHTTGNLTKPNQIIKAELNWRTDAKGANEFVTLMLEGNDQMSVGIPKSGWNHHKSIANLNFNKEEMKEGAQIKEWREECGNLETFVLLQGGTNVAGGLVSVGHHTVYRTSFMPLWLSSQSNVMVYDVAESGLEKPNK